VITPQKKEGRKGPGQQKAAAGGHEKKKGAEFKRSGIEQRGQSPISTLGFPSVPEGKKQIIQKTDRASGREKTSGKRGGGGEGGKQRESSTRIEQKKSIVTTTGAAEGKAKNIVPKKVKKEERPKDQISLSRGTGGGRERTQVITAKNHSSKRN